MVTEPGCKEEVKQLCAILQGLGRFKVYGNDAKTETLSFQPHKEYATEQWTDLAVKCLRKIGFTDVQNNKEKKNFFHSVHATIVCEYDLQQNKIQKANVQDIQALCCMFDFMKIWCTIFIPTDNGRFKMPYSQHLSILQNYLSTYSK